MAILRNSAKCTHCGAEVVSATVHDFVPHTCAGAANWSFAVDGGKEYIRRVGVGFIDTSQFTEDDNGTNETR